MFQRLAKLRALFRKDRLDRDMAEEMRYHLDQRIADHVADGMSPEDARFAAQRQFGNMSAIQEKARDQRGWTWFEHFGRDLRHGFRLLVRRPGFALAAVLTLALGIGANSAIFSVLNAVLLRPPPFDGPDRLVALWMENPAKGISRGRVSPADFVDWRSETKSFEQIALTSPGSPITVVSDGIAERASCQYLTPELFHVLAVTPVQGRLFSTDELRADPNVVVLSEGYWRRRFGGDPGVVGTAIIFNGQQHTIAGVVPRGCRVFNDVEPDIWRPLLVTPAAERRDTSRWLVAVARLKTMTTRAQAQAEMGAIGGRLAREHPVSNSGWTVHVVSLHEALYGNVKPLLYPLFGAVVFVLLIACTNLANLLLARGASRRKEMAIRSALGGGKARLFRQLLAEGLVLAIPGAALGLLFAWWGLRGIAGSLSSWLPRTDTIAIDGTVLGFTLLVSVLAALLAGLAPAWQSSPSDASEALRSSGAGYCSRRQRRLRSLLVIGEVALAIVLLSGAGLMLNSLLRLQRVELGFEPAELLTMEVSLGGKRYWEDVPGGLVRVQPATTDFFRRALEEIEALPQVQAAAMISWLPTGPQRGRRTRTFTVAGQSPPTTRERYEAGYNSVSSSYFSTMGIAMLQGRGISTRDTENAPWVVVINQAFARRYWPNENPIGKRLTLDISEEERPREVVGVVEDVRQVALSVAPEPEMYVSFPQQAALYPGDAYQGRIHMSIVVRTTAASAQVVGLIRARIAEIDAAQPVYGVQSVEAVVAQSIAPWRLYVFLLASFAILATALAGLGIHAVIAGSVAERRHEIGIRMALGARPGDVLALVFRHALGLVGVGLLLGLAGAQIATRSMQGWLYGVSTYDPATYMLVCGSVVLLTAIAVIRPARQATRVDPVVALRSE